jgi:hypothetical protein
MVPKSTPVHGSGPRKSSYFRPSWSRPLSKVRPWGVFLCKNLAAEAKRYPAVTVSPTYIDEQIRRSDSVLITSQKGTEAYCHRRSTQINEMFLALDGEHIAYSGTDLEAIA